ncbi:MAG: hypothetical protein J6S14_15450 [Clostridia bacterium]|nr:hypothetical protein [Clostridia bacterium]
MKLSEFKENYPGHMSVARFAGRYSKWQKTNGNYDFINVPCDDLFRRKLNDYLYSCGHNSFTHQKVALRMYFEWGGEACTDQQEKLEALKDIKKSILFPINDLTMSDPDEAQNMDFQNTDEAEIQTEETRAYVASPDHLLDLLKSMFKDSPDSLCAALMLAWDGISIQDICVLKNTDVSEDCSTVTVRDMTIEITKEFIPYLQRYRNNDHCISIEFGNTAYFTVDSEYFIRRTVKNENQRPSVHSRRPLTRHAIYRKLGVFNTRRMAETGDNAFYTLTNIVVSSRCWQMMQAERAMGGRYSVESLIKMNLNGDVCAATKVRRDYSEWLTYVQKNCRNYLQK